MDVRIILYNRIDLIRSSFKKLETDKYQKSRLAHLFSYSFLQANLIKLILLDNILVYCFRLI